MAQVRVQLRGKAVLMMGKNTVIRQIMRARMSTQKGLEVLMPYVTGNIGFIFTNESPKDIAAIIRANRVPAAAKAGVVAPIDFVVEPGPTGLDPGQTAFFQALNISTKIARGTVEIISPVHLIHKGEKVGASQVALLSKLNIRPFSYGLELQHVYDSGCIYSSEILDMPEENIVKKFMRGVSDVAALSLAMHYPNQASLPHIVRNAFMSCVAVALETGYDFPQAKPFKDFLENPDAFVSQAVSSEEVKEEVAAPVEEEEKEEEEEEVGAGGLFGDDDW
jgi:large subunit ribosomal protein LP0